MPGLDPGIHRPSQKMDCRVKAGNDEFGATAPFVIASEAKQSKRPRKELDCFVASLLARTMDAA
jgi:hypothetical protein